MELSRRGFFSLLPAAVVAVALPHTLLEDSDWLPHGAVLMEYDPSMSSGAIDPLDEIFTIGWKAVWSGQKYGSFIPYLRQDGSPSWSERRALVEITRRSVRRAYLEVHA